MELSREEITEIAHKVADELMNKIGPYDLAFHIAEHEVLGGGRVIDPARAKATPCKCFEFEGEEFCWSPGVLGLMSSKKNPEQIAQFCVAGKEKAGEGAAKRFQELKRTIGEAHKEWEEKGGGLRGWWSSVAKKLEEKGVKL